MTAMQNGEILLIAALGISTGAFVSSKIVHRFGAESMVCLGTAILAGGGLLLVLSDKLFGTQVILLIPLIFLSMTACGFLFPNALAIAFSHVQVKIGVAGAIYGSVQIFISMLMNFLLNMITHQDQALLGMFYLVLGALGFLMLPKNNRSSA